LEAAAWHGHATAVQLLLAAGTTIEAADTLMYHAVDRGIAAVERALLDAGADINKANAAGRTALYMTDSASWWHRTGRAAVSLLLRAAGAQ
jgi:ankyrin repeat protein